MKAPRRTGFTLIELLVVIAIIAILAAILFPLFAKAKVAGQRAACLGHIRQIGSAIKLYQQDYNGNYPSCRHAESMASPWLNAYWIKQLLVTYLKGRGGVFACPGAAKPFILGVEGYTVRNGYCYNEYIFYRDYDSGGPFFDDAMIPRPKHTLLLGDGHHTTLTDDWDDPLGPPRAMPSSTYPGTDGLPSGMSRVRFADGYDYTGTGYALRERHGGSNILFCDMHASNVKKSNYRAVSFPGYNPKNRASCQEWPVIWPRARPIPP